MCLVTQCEDTLGTKTAFQLQHSREVTKSHPKGHEDIEFSVDGFHT